MSIEKPSNKMDFQQTKPSSQRFSPDINMIVGAVLTAVAAIGCSTKLDDIERLNCNERGKRCMEFSETEALQRELAVINDARRLTDPTDFTLNPDESMSEKDIVAILNKRLSPNAPKATLDEWKQAGVKVEESEGGFTIVTYDDDLVMWRRVGCWDGECDGELRVFDNNMPTGRKEVIKFSGNEQGAPMTEIFHLTFASPDVLPPTEIWYEEQKTEKGTRKRAGAIEYPGYSFPIEHDISCVKTTSTTDNSWGVCEY